MKFLRSLLYNMQFSNSANVSKSIARNLSACLLKLTMVKISLRKDAMRHSPITTFTMHWSVYFFEFSHRLVISQPICQFLVLVAPASSYEKLFFQLSHILFKLTYYLKKMSFLSFIASIYSGNCLKSGTRVSICSRKFRKKKYNAKFNILLKQL
jgi:hypothetical protein